MTKETNHSCHSETSPHSCGGHSHGGKDWLMIICGTLIVLGLAIHFSDLVKMESIIGTYAHATAELLSRMWWGVLLGVFFVGILSRIPRELIMAILGKGGTFGGILRACAGGVLLDLCSHGILLVGMKLYERGASLGQIMAFLIASPWNSFSLTLIMIGLIGLKWTVAFIVLSMIIAIISGVIFDLLVKIGKLPPNPNSSEEESQPLGQAFKHFWKNKPPFSLKAMPAILKEGLSESRMVLRWLLLGVVIASVMRATIPPESFATYFGATGLGLLLTILFATIIEVCSEGSTPIAADIMTRANAPGNSFAFMMTGVSTDYTEIMAIKDTMKSWKIAFFLPLITLPQVLVVALILNGMGS